MTKVISTSYDIFNRKLFSLPKVLLLPGVMSRQPMLIVQVFPFIFISDWLKAYAVSAMTTKIEVLQKDINDLTAIRSKVESFDIKNAELLQRSGKGAAQFTERRWEELTVKIQSRRVVSDLISRSKGFFAFMQRNFVFTVLIDCALANLIAIGKIVPSEIFVFSRAIEDAVDMMLMRSRSEAELARMMTEIEKLSNLSKLLQDSKEPRLLRCHVEDGSQKEDGTKVQNTIILRNLHYSRGTATARADHLELGPGIYAVTGSNGSGKSTLFRILMSCHTNEKGIDLPPSINLLTPAEPLTESDDLIRETCCLVDDNEDDEEDEDQVAEDCPSVTDGSDSELVSKSSVVQPGHHKPKLSITMPSPHVVEISQNFYWPLYSKPIEWIFQDHISMHWNSTELESRVRKVAEELHSLEFFQAPQVPKDSTE
jgi:energy-coupling factor transporter ATP-binding protein EcfA2